MLILWSGKYQGEQLCGTVRQEPCQALGCLCASMASGRGGGLLAAAAEAGAGRWLREGFYRAKIIRTGEGPPVFSYQRHLVSRRLAMRRENSYLDFWAAATSMR